MTDAENQFFENMPGEIKEVLRWHADARSRSQASESIADFAGRFLGGMYEDGAVLPTNLSASAPEVLALVLLQHRTSPRSTGAWLNLGFALRRVALYRTQDPEETNRAHLQSAVQAFDRALELDPDNNGKNIKAWTGMSLAFHMLDMYEKELECCARALESDRSDPKLWLLYSFALKSAGREDEALSTMNDAYEAYIRAGKPDELREVFADVQSTTQRPCPAEDGAMKSVGGIHRTRLAASKVHRHLVKEARRTVQKLGWQVPEDDMSPTLVGAIPLPFPVPDSFETAFGYKGNLRFVQFGYTAGFPQFGYSDGGDDLPSDGSLWSWFLHHPAVAPYLPESRYPTLYGKFPSGTERPPLEQIMRRGTELPTCHCLLLDRRDRRAYVSERDQAMILFALMEPDDGDAHNVFVDGMLISPGSEDYKVAPPPGVLDEFRRFMDSRVQAFEGA